MSVPYHAWTHRPRAQGGTDPIEIAGAGEWCRLGFSDDYTVLKTTALEIVEFDVPANPFPDVFEIVDARSGGTNNAIQPLVDGVFAVTWGLYLSTWPTNSIINVAFEHTTFTHEIEVFTFPPLGADAFANLSSPILTGSKVFRSQPPESLLHRQVCMEINIDSTADADLVIVGGDLNVSYMEVVRLSSTDEAFHGDPNDYAVFP